MRAFLSLFLPLLISSLHAEKIITNPNWVARNTPVVTVDSILLRDTVSRMYITLKQLPHTSLTIHDDWVVQDSIKRFSGKVRDIDGVDFDRIFQFDSDSTIHIEMDFPALPPSLTEVDIIGNQKSNEIRIIGLSLTEKRNKTSIYPQPNPIYRSATPAITFDTDTAILQGKFVGYHKRLNLPDGKIILDDLFSGKQTEINIPIAPDGSFSAKIPTRYPIQQKLIFGDRYIPFYIEPTDTLYIETYLDELFAPYRYSGEIEQNCVHSTYRGKNARINYELREIRLKNISETEDWIKSLNTLSAQKYYTSEENKFKVKLEYVNSKYNQGEISDTSYHLSILNNYYNFICHIFVYMNIIDKNIINEYSIKNIDYTSFVDISAMNDPLSTTSEYYLPFLMLLESWRAMTTPPNWENSDFIKALEKRNIDLSNTEKETLKFVFGEIQTPPDNVERTIESFNKKSEKEQISMREEKLRALRKQTYETYFGPSTDFTCQLINTRSIIRLIHSLDRKLTETEIKEFTAPITDRRLLKVIDQTNFSYKPQSLQGH